MGNLRFYLRDFESCNRNLSLNHNMNRRYFYIFVIMCKFKSLKISESFCFLSSLLQTTTIDADNESYLK